MYRKYDFLIKLFIALGWWGAFLTAFSPEGGVHTIVFLITLGCALSFTAYFISAADFHFLGDYYDDPDDVVGRRWDGSRLVDVTRRQLEEEQATILSEASNDVSYGKAIR